MSADRVPHLVKHTTLAIWRSGDIAGSSKDRFVSSWNIARARLTEYGFLTEGSDKGSPETIRLTSKGRQREHFHAREPGGKDKSGLFDQMFRWVELAYAATKGQALPPATPDKRSEAVDATKATKRLRSRLEQKRVPRSGRESPPKRGRR